MAIKWIMCDLIISIHKMQVAEHGGVDLIRDESLLESALDKPKSLYHYKTPKPDIADLAASYAYGIAKTHPFADGNKRVAFVVCNTFLALNGVKINAPKEEKYLVFIKLVEGSISQGELASWIKLKS